MKNTTANYIIDCWNKNQKDINATALIKYDEIYDRFILEIFKEKDGELITTISMSDILYSLSDIIR